MTNKPAMKNKLVKVGVASYLGLVVLALAMTTTNGFAQDAFGGIVPAIQQFEKTFIKYVDYVKEQLGISTNYSTKLKTDLALTQTSSVAGPAVRDRSNESINELLAKSVLFVPSATNASQYYAGLMPTSQAAAKKQASLFNASNYLNTYALGTSAQNTTDFINTIANAGNPVQALPANAYDSLSRNPSASSFLSGMASFTARESVAIGALNQLIYERTPLTGASGGYSIDGKPASALSYDAKIASQRMGKDWYDDFLTNKDTTAGDLQRENVLIAAESLHEQFEIRMQLEQANATLAALLLSYEEGTNKPLLLNARNEAVAASLQR